MNAPRRAARKTLVTLLCLALCVACAVGVHRLVLLLSTTDGDFRFAVEDDGTARITEYTGSAASLDIPTELRGHAVSGIGAKSFTWRFRLKRVSVPNGVARIGDGAFAGCYALADIALPDSLAAIDSQAFAACRALSGIALPKGLEALGDRAFDQCPALTDIAVPNSVVFIGANPFSRCKNLSDVTVAPDHPTLSSGDGMLLDRSDGRLIWCAYERARGKLVLPPDVEIIGDSAFYGCDRLTDIELHDGVKEIRNHAFYGCAHLAGIAIPEGVRAIGNAAFCGCAGLTSAVIPDTVAEIGYLAFYDCAGLTDLCLPESVTAIGNGAFVGCRKLTLRVKEGSFAEAYCRNNHLPYVCD